MRIFNIQYLFLFVIFSFMFSCSENKEPSDYLPKNTDSISKSIKDTAHIEKAKRNFLPYDSITNESLTTIIQASSDPNVKFLGKKVSIQITGIDSRLGSGCPHADANHLLNIWLDSGKIEIISVPRGTFADAGFDDTTGLNYLANVRANRSRKTYLKTISEITGTKKIDYYVEFGFSQAIGLIELLGFKNNSVQMLRMLRSRKAFGIGDFQRAYNQGQFIRQMILSHFNDIKGLPGDALIFGAIHLVDTDLKFETAKEIIRILREKGFPRSPNDCIVRLK
ncbi:MAG: hypothetical protein WCT77_13645, partial [Bacteroidota bacterium]